MGKILDNMLTKIAFGAMNKGLTLLYKKDEEVKEFFNVIPDGTKIRLSRFGCPYILVFEKFGDTLYTYKKPHQPSSVDLEIVFKFSSSLSKILLGKNSIRDAYNNKEFIVKGQIRYAMAFVFAIEKFMAYFMPKNYIAKNINIPQSLQCQNIK